MFRFICIPDPKNWAVVGGAELVGRQADSSVCSGTGKKMMCLFYRCTVTHKHQVHQRLKRVELGVEMNHAKTQPDNQHKQHHRYHVTALLRLCRGAVA